MMPIVSLINTLLPLTLACLVGLHTLLVMWQLEVQLLLTVYLIPLKSSLTVILIRKLMTLMLLFIFVPLVNVQEVQSKFQQWELMLKMVLVALNSKLSLMDHSVLAMFMKESQVQPLILLVTPVQVLLNLNFVKLILIIVMTIILLGFKWLLMEFLNNVLFQDSSTTVSITLNSELTSH